MAFSSRGNAPESSDLKGGYMLDQLLKGFYLIPLASGGV